MWQIGIGIVAIAAIVVVALLQGINGALAMTGLTVIGGLFGWVAKKQKDIKGIGKVQIPQVEKFEHEEVGTVKLLPVPQRAKVNPVTKRIDFNAIETELRDYIAKKRWAFRYSTLYSLAHNRALVLKVKTIVEAIEGNKWLLGLADQAFNEAFGFMPSHDDETLEEQIAGFKANICRAFSAHELKTRRAVERLIEHVEGLELIAEEGVDWQKVAKIYKTVWMMGELAITPTVDITKAE